MYIEDFIGAIIVPIGYTLMAVGLVVMVYAGVYIPLDLQSECQKRSIPHQSSVIRGECFHLTEYGTWVPTNTEVE